MSPRHRAPSLPPGRLAGEELFGVLCREAGGPCRSFRTAGVGWPPRLWSQAFSDVPSDPSLRNLSAQLAQGARGINHGVVGASEIRSESEGVSLDTMAVGNGEVAGRMSASW